MTRLRRHFTPVAGQASLREITSIKEYEAVIDQELAVIFKHSRSCDASKAAYSTVVRFCSTEPDHTIFLISVPEFRGVSTFVEKQTGIQHESPQILAMRKGVVFAHASHGRISTAFLQTICPES